MGTQFRKGRNLSIRGKGKREKILFIEKPIKQLRQGNIPKEAPWKTSALNE